MARSSQTEPMTASQHTTPFERRRPPGSPPKIVIPPKAPSIPDRGDPHGGSERKRHAAEIARHGRMAWQRRHGYGKRSLAETAFSRIKTINDGTPHLANLRLPAQRDRRSHQDRQPKHADGEAGIRARPLKTLHSQKSAWLAPRSSLQARGTLGRHIVPPIVGDVGQVKRGIAVQQQCQQHGGVSGNCSTRLPMAFATAQAIAAPTLRIGTSPAPFVPSGPMDGAPSKRSISTGTTSSASGSR